MRTVPGVGGLTRHPGAEHLRQAVDVTGRDAEQILDLQAHRLGPRLGSEHGGAQRGVARIDALAFHRITDGQQVRRGGEDGRRPEVLDDLDLPVGLPAGHRDHRAAELLRPVVGAQTAGEEPVAVRVVDEVAGPDAGDPEAPGRDGAPHLQILLGVGDDSRLSGGARGSVDPPDLVHRHGQRPERIVGPEELLVGEREVSDVLEFPQIAGVHASGVVQVAVGLDVVVRVVQRPLQTAELQRADLLAAHPLLGIQLAGVQRGRRFHRRGNGVHIRLPCSDRNGWGSSGSVRGTRRRPRRPR
ncbi:hypothetical protein SDC9_80449 [bioreactor metagenome]|uniref:Uncharacterized protein n=1 Tax=bioreactor metagenome TaxID=1076179 RepID=A0A644Z0P6_9ZZZZ